ncbi:sulfate adenylyltransferase subunit CysD [uncultured Sphingomonas sp.]|uniref:sulfate adenylyltransferase subunit CysD n=1 Tax=uncultured Sphingomonas sp. TaxID=158754 RepID=UPI0035CB7740
MSARHLSQLEAESIFIFREIFAEAAKPVLLYSVGKDSAVLLHLARKAFAPGRLPFPCLHIASGWDFQDLIRHRDLEAARLDLDLIVHHEAAAAARGIDPFSVPVGRYVDTMLTQGLKNAIDAGGWDAAFGGARRDEEKARAKERIVSIRAPGHVWDPRRQRPELWSLFNVRTRPGETLRVFPLSNWTEADVWAYIEREAIPIVPLYLAAMRPTVERDGALLVVDDGRMPLRPGERVVDRSVRFRTLGCYPLTGAVESGADTLAAVIAETDASTESERAGRAVDRDQPASMERKKAQGYF